METDKVTNFVILDCNGIILEPKEGQESFLVTLDITDHFRNLLSAATAKFNPHTTTLERLQDALSFIFGPMTGENVIPVLSGGDLVDPDSGKDEYRKEHDQYFDGFNLSDMMVSGVEKFHAEGITSTIVSSIPYAARSRLRRELNPLWENLNPSIPAILNPRPNLISGIYLKPVATAVFGAEGDVYRIEDDLVVALWESYLFDIYIYLLQSKEQAIEQQKDHLSKRVLPPENAWGKLVFNSTPMTILQDMKNPNFSNRPRLRL